jgi:hypothetical protein
MDGCTVLGNKRKKISYIFRESVSLGRNPRQEVIGILVKAARGINDGSIIASSNMLVNYSSTLCVVSVGIIALCNFV